MVSKSRALHEYMDILLKECILLLVFHPTLILQSFALVNVKRVRNLKTSKMLGYYGIEGEQYTTPECAGPCPAGYYCPNCGK